ncbi:unnamed protein product [Arctogadus glacialis]
MDGAMEASYKYDVYFECPDVDNERKKKIGLYFKNKRKSCGGDCGPVDVFKGNVYRIAFKDQEVQLSVLKKRDHSIEKEDKIVASFIVHATPESLLPDPSTLTTTTPEADNPKVGCETKFPVAASPSQPMVQNHQLHFESSPLQNPLKEPPMAGQHPEDEPSSSGIHAQLDLDKNRVIVSGAGKIQPEEFKPLEDREEQGDDKVKETFKHSQADKVDFVDDMQGNPAEAESPSIRVQPHPSGFHKAGSLSWEEPQRRPLSDQPGSRDYMGSAAREVQEEKGSQRYDLPGGVNVLVCRGDITKVNADALVNAANGYLDHGGGVAAALSHAGGPEVQRESHALVKKHGKYATGATVMTTGGHLQCKKLIHIVGPVQGEAYGRERELLTRSVGSVLKLADDNKFQSIAIPCISSGIFRVPISLCAEAIVTAVSDFGSQSRHLKRIILIDTREEVVKALKAACESIFSSADAEQETAGDRQFHESAGASSRWSNSGANPVNHGEKGRIMNDDPSHKPHKQHEHQEEVGPAARQVQRRKGRQCYNLPGGVSVLVCFGDITQEEADVLVNAANRNLKHDGGVADALSRAGGPEVQKESTDLVRKHGQYAAGDTVMTTGGRLQCKKLIHIVRPEQGDENGTEKLFLKKSVWSALQLADDYEFKSIAMPCISSGNSKVLISECAEAIVSAVFRFGKQSQHLNKMTLIDTREEVVEALKAACDRMFSLEIAEPEASGGCQIQESAGASSRWSNTGADPVNTGTDFSGIKLETAVGFIEEQKVDAIVSPMKDHDPRSTGLGKKLSEIIGKGLKPLFQKKAKEWQLPVEVDVNGLEKLHCRKVFFVNLLPWDKENSEAAVLALKRGLEHVLTSCQDQRFDSVAFPMLGTGEVLQFPQDVAESALLEVIGSPMLNRHSGRPLVVRIVMHPSDPQTHKAMTPQQTNSNAAPRASFSRYVLNHPDKDTAMVGGVKLELVRADIVEEKTDVIVNTINGYADQSGVSKAILEAAGTHVKDEFAAKHAALAWQKGWFSTGPGRLNCKDILHATFYSDPKMIRETCEIILKSFEAKHHSSVSFPALGTGAGHMDPKVACTAMLDGIEAAVRSMGPTSLTLVRIVFKQRDVQKTFRSVLQNRCEETARQQQVQDDWEDLGTSTQSSSPSFSSSRAKPKPTPFLDNCNIS